MDRVKQLETAIEKAIGLLDMSLSPRSIKAVEILRAALAPAEKVPKLAKYQPCGCVICTCEDEHQCQGCGAKHCMTHPQGRFPNPVYEPEKIAVPDAPVSEPVPVVRWWFYPVQNRYCKTVNDRIVEDSDPRYGLGGLILRLTWREISEHEYLAAQPSTPSPVKPVVCLDCGTAGCKGDCVNTNDAEAKPVKVPVVRYYENNDYIYRVENGLCTECVQRLTGVAMHQDNWEFVSTACFDSTEAAYAAARKPAAPAIEPLGDTEFGRAEMHDKLNELVALVTGLVAWVNAMEGK